MPNRILREGILTSDRVDQIADDPETEVFYRRLFGVVDDYGLFSGDARIIRAAIYPLRLDRVPEARIREHVAACEEAGLLATYSVDGKPYLQILDFNQRLRLMKSKYPQRETTVVSQSGDCKVRRESESETKPKRS